MSSKSTHEITMGAVLKVEMDAMQKRAEQAEAERDRLAARVAELDKFSSRAFHLVGRLSNVAARYGGETDACILEAQAIVQSLTGKADGGRG